MRRGRDAHRDNRPPDRAGQDFDCRAGHGSLGNGQLIRLLLFSLFAASRSAIGLGTLRRSAVQALAAIGAYDLLVLIGHLVQEGGKRLTAVMA